MCSVFYFFFIFFLFFVLLFDEIIQWVGLRSRSRQAHTPRCLIDFFLGFCHFFWFFEATAVLMVSKWST